MSCCLRVSNASTKCGSRRLSLSAIFGVSFSGNDAHEEGPEYGTSITYRDAVIARAARHRLPAVYPFRLYVAAGGLMSYGTHQVEMFRQTASYVDHILRGANPACIERPPASASGLHTLRSLYH